MQASDFISEELLSRYNINGPRYTSYPTADRFNAQFGAQDYLEALKIRGEQNGPLSVYVHIPFCESLCYYCGCNKIITRHREWGALYLDYLDKEINQVIAALGQGRGVSQLHLGGGTPTFLSDDELSRLMKKLTTVFSFLKEAECSIEVDPRTVSVERLNRLKAMGFNRLSFGVQDFDTQVQQAVHRVQSQASVFELLDHGRQIGFESINIDLIYGLPLQTASRFQKTLETVIELKPDRIAVYGYAHLPERFKSQRRIAEKDLPLASEKLRMLAMAIQMLTAQAYEYIGMDHFALKQDALSVAKRQGRLHRNFQGYTTQPDSDMIGLGVSSIGAIGPIYSQNVKTLDEYYACLDQDQLPVERGLALTREDEIRRAAIHSIMCNGQLIWETFSVQWQIDAKNHFQDEIQKLQEMAQEGLLSLDEHGLGVTEKGWFFVRLMAMVFDEHLQKTPSVARYSRVL